MKRYMGGHRRTVRVATVLFLMLVILVFTPVLVGCGKAEPDDGGAVLTIEQALVPLAF